jgi:hypothetical protein
MDRNICGSKWPSGQGARRRDLPAHLNETFIPAWVADEVKISADFAALHESVSGTKQRLGNVRFSNRLSRVKHFQAIHHFSVDVARGLALLFGLGTMALPSWDSKTRWNNLLRDLAVEVTAGSSGHTNSPHPSSREGHHSTVGWISGFLLFELILTGSHAATSLVHRNSVPSTQMRCMITANRRASATIAFFIPRCLAIFSAQALSQDHFIERTSMIWAAS